MSDRKPLIPTPERVAQVRRELNVDEQNNPITDNPLEQEANRVAAMAIPPPEEISPKSAFSISPTGTPVVPPAALPYLGILFAVAAAVAIKEPDILPTSEWDQKIALLLIAVLGYVSPGFRRR